MFKARNDSLNHFDFLTDPASGYAATHHTMTSGRPSAILNHARCTKVWNEAVPSGDTLARADAGPYIVNWHQADPDSDNSINKKEFFRAYSPWPS